MGEQTTAPARHPSAEEAVAQVRAYADRYIAEVLPMDRYDWTSAEAFARWEAAWKSLRVWKTGERSIMAAISGPAHGSIAARVLDHVDAPVEIIMAEKTRIEPVADNVARLVWDADC